MDYTIMSAYFQGRLGVVEFKGKIYDLSGYAKWVIVKDLMDAGLIEEVKHGETTMYCLSRRNDTGSIIYDSRRYTPNVNKAIVLCQEILDPFTIQGHRIYNNAQVRHLKSLQPRGIFHYKGLGYDLDQSDQVNTLSRIMASDGIIELMESSNDTIYHDLPWCRVLDPKLKKMNQLDHLLVSTCLVNLKPFYQDEGEN